MFIPTSRQVKSAARASLNHTSYDPKKLALIYAGVSSGVALLITVITYIVSSQIDSFGGIAGMGTKDILLTLQGVLPILGALFIPFWDMGMLRTGIGFMRNEEVSPDTLTSGLRRFGVVFRLLLLRTILLIVITILTVNISSIVFSLTPWSAPIQNLTETVATTGELTEEMIVRLMPSMLPLYGIFFAVFCLIAIPFFYRLRMADFIIMDTPAGALAAILFSRQLMRGNRFKLFKLDLSFWWYYVVSFAAALIAYLPDFLQLGGISLPVSGDVAYFLCYGAYLLIQFLLNWQAASYIQTSYAIAFDSIAPKAPTIEQPQ